jgi:CPA2 family monovalent cation:H+ antiporter-2
MAVSSFVFTLVLSGLIGLGLYSLELVRNPWMMALILSTTSLGVVVPVLKERGLSSGRYGQSLLISALIADFTTMFLITILVALLSRGLTLDILLVGGLFVAFFLIYRVGMLFFNQLPGVRQAMDELSHATGQIKVRAAFGMMLTFVVLSEFLGTEVILGAFLAGAVVSLLRTPDDVELVHKLESIGFGFFIPIFFIMVGVNFNIKALLDSPQSLILVPLILLAAIAVKLLPMLVYRLAFSWRETLGAGALLSARLSLIIAASAIGLELGVISETVNSAIILVAILTVSFAPLIFLQIMPEPEAARPRLILVAGAGELGLQVARNLRSHNEQVIMVESDPARLARAQQAGLEGVLFPAGEVHKGDGLADVLEQAGALVCTYDDVDENYRICELARTQYGIDHIVAQVNQPSYMERFEQLGVVTMNASLDRAMLLVLLTRNPGMYQLLTRTDDDKEVMEVQVQNLDCCGKRLHELRLPGDVLVLALRRNGDLLVPHGNTRLEEEDHLTLVGSLEHIQTAQQVFMGERQCS